MQIARQATGLTQKQLAEKSGVSLSTIQKYERGAKDINNAGLNVVMALCKALGCSVADLRDDWFEIVPDPEAKVVAMFEELTPEGQVSVLKACAEHVGWTVSKKK